MRTIFGWMAVAALCASVAHGADPYGLTEGPVELKSVSTMAFGPGGILLVGDSTSGAIWAIATGDRSGEPEKAAVNVENLGAKLGEKLGVAAADVTVADVAVNPISGNVYVAASAKGKGAALVRIDSKGALDVIELNKIAHSKAVLSKPTPPPPADAPKGKGGGGAGMTDLAYVDGQIIVSGGAGTLRTLAFPFTEVQDGSGLEIFHGAHGKTEENVAIRTFVPIMIDGKPNVLAGFTCTPLVRFPVKGISPGQKLKGTTVAELGNRNRPLDMIHYKKDGADYLLLANSARGVMKISTEDIGRDEGITKQTGIAGQKYDTIAELAGAVQLDKLNDTHAVVLVANESGQLNLKTVALP